MATVVTHKTFSKEDDLRDELSKVFSKAMDDAYAGIEAASILVREVKELEYSNVISFSKEFRNLDMIIQIENLADTEHGLTVTYEV